MGNQFNEHADNERAYHVELAGDDGTDGTTLTVCGVAFPCTIDKVEKNWTLGGGKSSMTMVRECEFLLSDAPASIPNSNPAKPIAYEKGLNCQLKLNPTATPMDFMLWDGGLLAGGYVYRFVLVDRNYRG